ncbi:MAG TPA: hypothetical protein VFF90_06440, partial [Saprospiraceae bacterium]|nr:hypothetical protein [Saprospiraceae bacterium]
MNFAIQNLLILICLVAGNCPAIGQYGFLKIYGINDTKSLNFDDLIWNKDGVVVRGNIYIDSLNRWGLFLCLIDTSGSIVWQHIYPDSKGIDDVISNTPTRFTTTTDKGFLLPVSYFERGNTGVYKTDSIGNLEFTAEYINSEKTMIPNNIVISSGNYFISGIHQRNDYNVDIFVQKIDSTGILKWLKYYGGNELNEFGEIIIDNLG